MADQKMKKICTQCQTEMIEDCKVESFGGITISKKDKVFLIQRMVHLKQRFVLLVAV
jgi:hypothetical protein